MEQELRDRWAGVAGRSAAAEATLEGLLSRYREPHRHYHGLAHVLRVLRTVDELLAAIDADQPDAIRFAGWYHDAVYDPTAADNEEASARLAERDLADLGQPAALGNAVARLVLATATHEVAAGDPDAAVLIDADLAVLGADPATYAAYVKGVRREYADLDDEAWRAGRSAVLAALLGRAPLFHTAPMRGHEPRARANLTAELAGLSAPPSGDAD